MMDKGDRLVTKEDGGGGNYLLHPTSTNQSTNQSINRSIKKCIPHTDNKVQHIHEELMWERGSLSVILIIHS